MNRLHSASPGQARVLMVGGGSAGHVAPMIAVAEVMEQEFPGTRISFVCSDKPSDAAFLAMENRTCATLPLPKRSFALPFLLLSGFVKALKILTKEKPDVVFSKGGYVSVPLCLAAWSKRIPIVVHESDAVMGKANRFVAMLAKKVCLGFDTAGSTKNRTDYPLLAPRSVFTGNPIRSRILQGKKEEGLRITGLDGRKPVLLVMGGSQGAASINGAIARHLDALLAICDIIHLTGPGKSMAANRQGYYATEFGSDVLPHFYAAADLAVSRAGAGSIAELAGCGIPAILIPIRGLAGDHQVRNAEATAAAGNATVLSQEHLEDLPGIVRTLLRDSVAMQTMRENSRYAAKPEAARLIAETVLRSVARACVGA